MKLSEAKAVVTGGASGLGFATAQRVIDAGGQVCLLDINDELGNESAAILGERASFNRVIQINLVGTYNVTKEAAAVMNENEPGTDGERGVIISTASIAAFEGQIGQAAYSASKGGVVGMMLPLAREFASFGIRVNTIAPGVFLTPMVSGMPQEVQDSLGAQVPFPSRLGKPEEYANAAQFIYETAMVNAEVIRVDGAIRMQAR